MTVRAGIIEDDVSRHELLRYRLEVGFNKLGGEPISQQYFFEQIKSHWPEPSCRPRAVQE